jgi:hypothetical protein
MNSPAIMINIFISSRAELCFPRAIFPLLIRNRTEDVISRRLPWNVTQVLGVRSQLLTASAVARTQVLWQ